MHEADPELAQGYTEVPQRPLCGEAVFNIQLNRAAGVFLLEGLAVATLGNGVFLSETFPECHEALFAKLTPTLTNLKLLDDRVISWSPGAISYTRLGIACLNHSHILIPTDTLFEWRAQSRATGFQRGYFEGTTHHRLWDMMDSRTSSMVHATPLLLTRHTWLEELHEWLQDNAFATSLVRFDIRMETMRPVIPDPLNRTYDFEAPATGHQMQMALMLHGVFLGRFGAVSTIPIEELKRHTISKLQREWMADDKPQDHLSPGDFAIGTLLGPMKDGCRLGDYVFGEMRLIFLVPRPEATDWVKATNTGNRANAFQPATATAQGPNARTWAMPVPLAPGAVVRIHSLTSSAGRLLNGRVAMILLCQDDPTRWAVQPRVLRSFNDTVVKLKTGNVSFLWWEHPSHTWRQWNIRDPRVPPSPRYLFEVNDTVLIHSIPTTPSGVHINGCHAILKRRITNPVLGGECWEATLTTNNRLEQLSEEGGHSRVHLSHNQFSASTPVGHSPVAPVHDAPLLFDLAGLRSDIIKIYSDQPRRQAATVPIPEPIAKDHLAQPLPLSRGGGSQ